MRNIYKFMPVVVLIEIFFKVLNCLGLGQLWTSTRIRYFWVTKLVGLHHFFKCGDELLILVISSKSTSICITIFSKTTIAETCILTSIHTTLTTGCAWIAYISFTFGSVATCSQSSTGISWSTYIIVKSFSKFCSIFQCKILNACRVFTSSIIDSMILLASKLPRIWLRYSYIIHTCQLNPTFISVAAARSIIFSNSLSSTTNSTCTLCRR